MIKLSHIIMVIAGTLVTITSCNSVATIKHLPYPETKRGDVVDNYFGTEVADPYRWLEDDNSEETGAWVEAENVVTNDYLSQIPFRTAIQNRLTELWNYPKESAPTKHGDYYYYSYNNGLQNQSIMYRVKELGGEAEVFLDPNKLSDDGTVALASLSFSENGEYCAYGTSASGSDWVEIRVIKTESKTTTDDVVKWVKFSGASWDADSKGFYYSAYDAPKSGVFSSQNRFQKIYYHKVGTAQSGDKLIYSDTKNPLRYFSASESKDGEWIFVTASEGTSGTELLYKSVGSKNFKVLLPGFEYDFTPVKYSENSLYVLTNKDAANRHVIKVDLKNPTKIVVAIPENKENMLESISSAGDDLFASYLEDAQSKVYQYSLSGELIREVSLPSIGSASGFSGKKEVTETYYYLTNFTTPSTIYKYDIASGKSELYKAPEVKFDPSLYATEQIFYTSKDGTKVPMFVVHRKDIKLNGKNPCYLYAYGGFQINLTPSFSPSAIMFLEQGGVYCIANLRGGSEYGDKWHEEGMLENKQNVFDDFIAAAEYLIDNKYTSSSKLAIAGGSNGGLLVGACEIQRPDLFAVCLPAVGVLDMLRYHKFTIGWGWAVEYGSSDNEEQFNYIYKYSPLHNIKDGVEYPATLITTADHDDRVVPAHSFKFAAQMQHSQAGDKPILIRIESKAGHGAGKPTSKRIEEAADIYSFVFQNTNTQYRTVK